MLGPDNIHLFEEHSSTLPVWWAQHDSARTVVYLDAHLDLQKTASEALAALKACTSVEAVRGLEAPSHLNPSTRYAYGIENFLYPAHQLGLIKRLVWVAPPHIPRRYSSELLEYMQQMDGIEFDELTGFREIGGNMMQGSLMGLDITICDYEELGSLNIDSDYSLDIDIDYFVEVPADRLWIDPATVVNAITEQLGKPSLVTISRAVSSGFTPLAYRFVGDFIYSLFNKKEIEIGYYQKLSAAVGKLDDGDMEAGRHICQQLVDERPEIAGGYYILALASTDAVEKKRLLESAGNLDQAYRFDLAREAIGQLHRKKAFNPGVLQRLMSALENMDLDLTQRQQAEIALAQLLAASGNTAQAHTLLARQTGDYANHDDVSLSIVANQLAEVGKHAENERMLRSVANSEKNGTAATLYLGDLEFAQHNFQAALEHYTAAHDRARAWMMPLERMLACYRQLGINNEASAIEQKIAARRQRLDEVIKQS